MRREPPRKSNRCNGSFFVTCEVQGGLVIPVLQPTFFVSPLTDAMEKQIQRERKRKECTQSTHLPPTEESAGNSWVKYWVLPIAPHIRVPVASRQSWLILSPVWQPQLFT